MKTQVVNILNSDLQNGIEETYESGGEKLPNKKDQKN